MRCAPGPIRWVGHLWITLSVCIGVLASCGGGVGSGGTGAFASGPISGFGSIIVNDVVYDDTVARIEDDTGAGRARSELGLGTVVEIDSDAVRNAAATASRVRISSERIGRVDAVAPGVLTVNGLPVRYDSGTVFDPAFGAGAAGIAVGAVIEVHGFATDNPGVVLATRIEPRSGAAAFKFRGAIAALNTQARSFRIGNQNFVYDASVSGRDTLAEGAFLRVWTRPMRDAGGRWVVTAIGTGQSAPPDDIEVKIHGVITLFVSSGNFQVGPWTVDASTADIDDGPLALGRRVKIEGVLRRGVLVAREVDVRGNGGDDGDDDDDEDDDEEDDEDGDDARDRLQMRGTIAAVDLPARRIELQGRRDRVSFARDDLVFQNGNLASLTVGRRVHVFGRPSADGSELEARRIRIDD